MSAGPQAELRIGTLVSRRTAIKSEDQTPAFDSVVDLESLAGCWLVLAKATTLDDIEAATLAGLLGMVDAKIAYTARRTDAAWTISTEIGLRGDVMGTVVPEKFVPYAQALLAGETICYADPAEMGGELAPTLAAIGVGSLYAVPIMSGALCVGALVIGQPEPSTFSQRDRALARLFASHLSELVAKRDLVTSLETLAESVPVILLRTDPSGWINWYNRRWYEYTGQTPEEAAGWGWQTAHHPIDFQRVIEEWPQALATGKPIEIEFRLRRHDGVYHWHLARVEPVRNDKGRILSWYGSVIDIEAQKRALERSKRVADSLQNAFLPQRLPQRKDLRLDASYVSAEADALVGGDRCDAFDLRKLRQSIYTLARQMDDPAEILRELNQMLAFQEPDIFVTALVGFVDRASTQMRYATAGHPPPIIAYRHDEPATLLWTGGPPLGVVDDLQLSTHIVPIMRDAVVVLYTDGMTEFTRDAISGEAKLRAAIPSLVGNTSVTHPAKVLYETVLAGLAAQDDAAMLVLQFSPVGSLGRPDESSAIKRWGFHASDAKAAHVARQEIGAYISRILGETEQTQASELIVGELLANTVGHAPGLVDLTIEWNDDDVVLTVRDSGPGLSTLLDSLPTDMMQEGRRGLFLVHAVSPKVTVVASPTGGAELRVILPIKGRPYDAQR